MKGEGYSGRPADGTLRRGAPRSSVEGHFESLALTGDWEELYDAPETAGNVSFRVRLSRALDLLPPGAVSVLDVGCGPAPLGPEVLDRGGRYVGLDVVGPMLQRARLREPRACLIRGGSALPFLDGVFDAVVALGFVEYLPDIEDALREMGRVVRPGGVVVVSIPKRVHLDQIMVGLASPFRQLAAKVWGRRSDSVRRTLLQPAELDRIALSAGLHPAGGMHYHFTPLPYPLTVLLPTFSLRATRAMESWKGRHALGPLGHGYLGRYERV